MVPPEQEIWTLLGQKVDLLVQYWLYGKNSRAPSVLLQWNGRSVGSLLCTADAVISTWPACQFFDTHALVLQLDAIDLKEN